MDHIGTDHTGTDHGVHERPRHAAVLGGRYALSGLLGRGGMSEVYRAQDQVMQREVAVKVLRANGSDDTMPRRMAQEARIVAAVDHPHLVRVHDAGCEDGRCYLVMELVDGGTLGDLVARGPVPAQLAARIGAQLAQALGAIHAAGFVHRDIKPANVLLARPADPNDVSARLTDFGIARMVDGTRLTSTGLMLGTAPYLSPEQVLGTLVGYPSDVYALGLLLLECRTAAQAYPGPAVESAVARLHRQPDVPADLGPAWVALLTAMTAREPADRPTAEQVAASLSELAEGRVPAGDGALLAGPSDAEPVGDLVPARRGLVARAARGAGRGSPGHHPRGAHATHPSSRRPEGEDAARNPLPGARRLLGAAAAAAAVFTAAALVSGSSSAFRGERHAASQPAHHRAATTSGTSGSKTSPSLAKSPGKRAAAAGAANLAGTVAGGSASVQPAARTSANDAGAVGTRGGSISSRKGSGSTSASASFSASGSSHSAAGTSSSAASTTGTTGTPGAKGSHAGPGSSHGHGDGNGNGNVRGSGHGHGSGHSATGAGTGGTTAAPPSSAPTPTTSDPTSSNPPSSSDPTSSPTSSPTSTPDPAVSTSDPTLNPLASSSTTSDSNTSDSNTNDSTTNDSTTGVAGAPSDLLP